MAPNIAMWFICFIIATLALLFLGEYSGALLGLIALIVGVNWWIKVLRT